jgi:membrane glycosyltransferase
VYAGIVSAFFGADSTGVWGRHSRDQAQIPSTHALRHRHCGCGLGLAVSPVAVARLTNQLRFAPYSTDAARLRYYRIIGLAMIALGIVIGAILS